MHHQSKDKIFLEKERLEYLQLQSIFGVFCPRKGSPTKKLLVTQILGYGKQRKTKDWCQGTGTIFGHLTDNIVGQDLSWIGPDLPWHTSFLPMERGRVKKQKHLLNKPWTERLRSMFWVTPWSLGNPKCVGYLPA